MNYKVTITDGEVEATAIVESAHFKSDFIRLVGLDPTQVPSPFSHARTDDGVWVSKGPAFLIRVEGGFAVTGIEPTQESVPEPDVNY